MKLNIDFEPLKEMNLGFNESNSVGKFNLNFSERYSSNTMNGKTARISYVTLSVNGWQGDDGLYSQVVTIEGATENSQVDLTPSVEQLAIFYNKDLTFVTENDNGIITVYAIGQKPQNEYTIQVTLTEVIR